MDSGQHQTDKHASNTGFGKTLLLVVLCLMAGAFGAFLYERYAKTPVASPTSSFDGNNIVTKGEQDIASVATKVAPSVVSIITTGERQSTDYGTQEESGAGTGIIISQDGYILTNNHVVSGARSVGVVMADGTTYDEVEVIGRDPLNDVAFIKINGVSELTAAQLGDSKSLRIGQNVVAIGNALGQYQNTVTSGIISGTGRSVAAGIEGDAQSVEELSDLIQTDAAINPGNSGGPLVNMAGQVIGINTAIASDASNVGFVIPISATKGVIASVLKTGKVTRAYLGVRYIGVTPEVAKQYKLSVKQGAYVTAEGGIAVVRGGPADKAGIRDKDLITKVNGTEIGQKGSVSTLIGEYKVGDTVELTVLRGGKIELVKVTLAAYAG